MSLLETFTFLSFWAVGLGLSEVEQSQISISTEVKKSIKIHCKITSSDFEGEYIHWYRQKPKKALEHLISVSSTKSPARASLGGRKNKLEARKYSQTSTSVLTVNFIENEDVAIYYCAGWAPHSGWSKKFGEGTKLTVIPSDRRLPADISPKPTIFLPSIAEIKRHKAGTHLCLLENFFPDVIKVYWKEKNGNRILESQEGKTMKTSDTYMKLSWLTVTERSMDKEHKCIVQHEKNKGGVDQEILFPSVNQVVASMTTTIAPTTASTTEKRNVPAIISRKVCLKDEISPLQLQLSNVSAYYTYLLLLLKGAVYFAIIAFGLFRRTEDCDMETVCNRRWQKEVNWSSFIFPKSDR
uniref:Ig-like domain-containing protein n=1 Tax=Equus asinus TaxID=9793 RepID=A0A9L0INE9_EQUAS